MLCGSAPARVDEKSRLKIPVRLQRDLPETEDGTYFITSDNGECAQIYPFPVWERISQKLLAPPRMPAKTKYERITSYYGAPAQMDNQGRVLIPPVLREDAHISGDVVVIARSDHLEVWNNDSIRKSIKEQPLTEEDREQLANQGI